MTNTLFIFLLTGAYSESSICKYQEQYTIKISSKEVSMRASSHPSKLVTSLTSQRKTKTKKPLTRFLKSKIEKAIQKGEYDHAIKELQLLDEENHWVKCRQVYVLFKMQKYQQAKLLCSKIKEKEPTCKECSKLFDLLSQKRQKQQIPEIKMNANSPLNLIAQPCPNLSEKCLSSPQQDTTSRFQISSKSLNFLNHLKKNDCIFKSIEILEKGPGYRCVHASESIPKNEIVMFIPHKQLITVETAKKSKVVKEIEHILPLLKSPKHTLLALFLLEQEQKGKKSQFYYYLSMLPKNLNNFPIFYSSQLLEELKNTNFLYLLERRKQDLEDDYHKICKISTIMQRVSLRKFQEARMIIGSRIFGILVNGVKTDALVPLADMLNHSMPKMTTWSFEDEKNGFVVRNVEQDIKKGDQIYDSYGCKCNSRFLLNYGFVQPYNPANELEIKLKHREKRRVSRGFKITRDNGSNEFEQLLNFCRGVVGQWEDEDSADPTQFVSRHNELKAWTFFMEQFEGHLSRYPTSIIKGRSKIVEKKKSGVQPEKLPASSFGRKINSLVLY